MSDTGRAGGALPGTASVVGEVIAEAESIAGRADGAGLQLHDDVRALLTALGGGPPQDLRRADGLASSAVGAFAEASAALADAVRALHAFSARTT